MNDDIRYGRLFEDGLHDIAPLRAPDRLRTQVKTESSRVRPRPRWLALIKESPMRTNSRLAVGSPTARVAAIMVATLLIAALVIGASFAGAQIFAADGPIIVDQSGDGDYTTITDAVAAADDGDEILVRPATYNEAFVIDKNITLMGEGPREAIVITTDQGPIIRVIDSDAVLSNLTLSGPTSTGVVVSGGAPVFEGLMFDRVGERYVGSHCREECRSLGISDGSRATVRGSSFVGGGEIDVNSGAVPLIENNEFSDGSIIGLFDGGDGVLVRGNRIDDAPVRAIGVFGPVSATIEDNVLSGARVDGITISPDRDIGPETVIRGNLISGSMIGINVLPQAAPTIEGNDLVDNTVGLSLSRSDASVEGNLISGGGAGIVVHRGTTATLTANTIEGSTRGIFIDWPASPTLIDNTVCATEENLVITDGAEPVLTNNELCPIEPPE